MISKHSIAIVLIVLFTQAARAQVGREEATMLYLDGLAQLLADEERQPVDANLAMEGMSSESFLDDLTPGYVIIEGDIQIPIEEFERLLQQGQTAAVFGAVNYWGTTVPYGFEPNLLPSPDNPVSQARRAAAISAMSDIAARAGIVFRLRVGTDPDWISFQQSAFNNSPVGRQGNKQIINIASWNSPIVIVHEIYHSLGFWHEQSAPDRNTFVTINFPNVCGSSSVPGNQCNANVCQGCADNAGNFISCAFNFNITSGAVVWGPYDFDSFMHYGRTAFSCNGNDTITVNAPWNAAWQNGIGQRTHFGLIDELSCRGIYPFAGDRWLRSGTGGTNAGTFFNPFRGTFTAAYNSTPANGTLLIDPGTYSGVGVYSVAKIIRATYGPVTIGN